MSVMKAFSAVAVQPVNGNSTFILDTPSFQDLQRYLDVAVNLPSTEARFNEQFNKADFELYLEDDKELYKALQDKIAEICEHCGTFQESFILAMLLLARGIAIFVTHSNMRYTKLRVCLTTAIAEDTSLREVKDALASARGDLNELARRANGRKPECEELIAKLTNFRHITVTDRDELSSIHNRFVQVMPDGVLVSTVMNTMSEEPLAACEKTRDAKQKWWENGRPGISAALLNFLFPGMEYSPVRIFDEIERDVESYSKVFQAALAKHDLLGKNLRNSLVQVKALILALTTICDTIDNAVKCLQSMINAFGETGTYFTELSEELQGIATATTRQNMQDCCTNIWEGLEDPPKMWTDIPRVAGDFARNGRLLDEQRRRGTA